MPNRNRNRNRRNQNEQEDSSNATGDFLSNVNMPSDPQEFIQATSQGIMAFMQQAMENLNNNNSDDVMDEEDLMKGLQVPTATLKIRKQIKDLALDQKQIWFAHLDTERTHEGSWNTCTVWLVTKEQGSNGQPIEASDGLSSCLYLGKQLSPTSLRRDAHDLVRDVIAQCCLDPKGGLFKSMTARMFPPKGTLKTAFPPQRPAKILVDSQGTLEYLKQDVVDHMGIPELGVAEAALVQSASTGMARTVNYGLDHIPVPEDGNNANNNEWALRQMTASTLLASDYVSEEPAPFRGWKIPKDASNMPRHWFIRPPQDFDSYRLTDLWGWRTNLERAIVAGDWALATRLVEEHDLEEIREFLEIRIVLTKVAEKGHTKACRFLLDRCGVAVDGMQAPNSPKSWKVMQIDAGGEGVTTPLHRAAYQGFADAVQFLLKRGASVHAIDEMGPAGTPLHHAVSQGHADCVRILCQHGSSLSYKTPDGLDAMLLSKRMAAGQQENIVAMHIQVQQVLREFDPRCSNCFEEGVPTKNCPCRKERYCGRKCQKARWKEHKKYCSGKPSVVEPEDKKDDSSDDDNDDVEEAMEVCANCGVTESSKGTENDTKLRACTRCYNVVYCGRDCQRSHWKVHKKQCGVSR